jgi:hypothetical protein
VAQRLRSPPQRRGKRKDKHHGGARQPGSAEKNAHDAGAAGSAHNGEILQCTTEAHLSAMTHLLAETANEPRAEASAAREESSLKTKTQKGNRHRSGEEWRGCAPHTRRRAALCPRGRVVGAPGASKNERRECLHRLLEDRVSRFREQHERRRATASAHSLAAVGKAKRKVLLYAPTLLPRASRGSDHETDREDAAVRRAAHAEEAGARHAPKGARRVAGPLSYNCGGEGAGEGRIPEKAGRAYCC